MGNNYTNKYYNELREFRIKYNPKAGQFMTVASYIRNQIGQSPTNTNKIHRVVQDIFLNYPKREKEEIKKLFLDSINSYDVNRQVMENDDETFKRLYHLSHREDENRYAATVMLKHYIFFHIEATQRIKFPIIKNEELSIKLNEYLIEILRRQVGVMHRKNKQKTTRSTFELLSVKNFSSVYSSRQLEPSYPPSDFCECSKY